MSDTDTRIWSEPLTDNEREIIDNLITIMRPGASSQKWLLHLLNVYDGRTASLESELSVLRGQLAAAETERDEARESLRLARFERDEVYAVNAATNYDRANAAEDALREIEVLCEPGRIPLPLINSKILRIIRAAPRSGRESHDATLKQLRDALGRAAFVSRHLMEMIDRDTWRASGGDDGQGHYEGDYHAEKTAEEIEGWAALAVPVAPSEDTTD